MDKEEKLKLKRQKTKVAKAQAEMLKKLESDDKIRVKFQNIEFPGAELIFNFKGIKKYILFDGMQYDLPIMVVDHLNSLSEPIYKMYDPKEETEGFNPEPIDPNERIVGSRNRFSVIPVSVRTEKKPAKASATKPASLETA